MFGVCAQSLYLGLDTLCFIFAYYSIPLCSTVMPLKLLKLTYCSQIMLKNFLVHRQNIYCTAYHTSSNAPQNIRPYACACSERRPTHNYHFSHAEKGLRLAYYSPITPA